MNKFVIFAHARSGSTSLAISLSSSPDVCMAIEPFHPKFSEWNIEEPDYYSLVKDKDDFNNALDELYSKYTAIKVLQYQFPSEIYLELLNRKDIKILFLRRKNYLAGAISGLIAEQTGNWQRDDNGLKTQIDYSKLKPLNIARLTEIVDYVSEQMEFYEQFLKANRQGSYLKLYYEDLFSEDQNKNLQTIQMISTFLQIAFPKTEDIEKYMTPSKSQINANGDYKRIPNYQEIMDAFSGKSKIYNSN